MRLAGTCSRYSNRAMPQLTSAAIHHGLAESSFKWAYQAKIMNTFEPISIKPQSAALENCIRRSFQLFARRTRRGDRAPARVRGFRPQALFQAAVAARTPARACEGAARQAAAD